VEEEGIPGGEEREEKNKRGGYDKCPL